MKEFELHSERFPSEVAYSYTSRQKAELISEGDHTLSFVYGHDNHRRKTIYSNQDGIQLEKYFIGLYEKEVENNTIRHINYIMAGDGMTAIVVQEEERFVTQGGENDENEPITYYTYKDHLGSIVALTDISGNVVMEQSFDAWGRYRNPQDWTYNTIEETPTWLRGYTGHEHLPHFDLINMNGRVYDPILGRMLSPDIYVQDPLFSQSYNRYSYCWNNPLRYTDPSGDIVIAPIIIGAAIGGFTGWQIGKAKGAEGWAMAGYVIGGAIIGGVSGGLASYVGTSGMAFANTAAIASGSFTTSVGMHMLSGGRTDVNIGFGAGSYNISSNEVNGIWNWGDLSTGEKVGYSLGSLANVSDVLAGLNPGKVQLNTEKDVISHSAITKVNENNPKSSYVSVGPDPGGKWIFNPLKFKKGTNNWKNYVDAGDNVFKVEIEGINVSRIEAYGRRLNNGVKYNLYFSSCVNHAARALTLSGVPTVGIHPAILHAQMYLRSIGFRPIYFTHNF